RKMLLRIGVNMGEVIVDEDNDIFGDGVNMAARLQAMADPGGIIVSAKVFYEVEGRVPTTFVDGGEHQVKNIARPVRIFRIIADAPAQPVVEEEVEPSIKSSHSKTPVTTVENLPPPVVAPAPERVTAERQTGERQSGERLTEPGTPPANLPPRTVTRTRTTIRRRAENSWTFSGKDRDGVTYEILVRETDLKDAAAGMVIGRHTEQCEIVVAHGSLSRRHARLVMTESHVAIEDLDSTNGTVLDGMR